jgi:hypothetical protein
MKSLTIACAFLLLTGCAAGVKPMTTPDGKPGFLISCDGSADDWTTCYSAATAACKGAYNVVDRNETSTATAYGPMVRRHMVAECKATSSVR